MWWFAPESYHIEKGVPMRFFFLLSNVRGALGWVRVRGVLLLSNVGAARCQVAP